MRVLLCASLSSTRVFAVCDALCCDRALRGLTVTNLTYPRLHLRNARMLLSRVRCYASRVRCYASCCCVARILLLLAQAKRQERTRDNDTPSKPPKRRTPPVDLPEALLGFPGPPAPPDARQGPQCINSIALGGGWGSREAQESYWEVYRWCASFRVSLLRISQNICRCCCYLALTVVVSCRCTLVCTVCAIVSLSCSHVQRIGSMTYFGKPE